MSFYLWLDGWERWGVGFEIQGSRDRIPLGSRRPWIPEELQDQGSGRSSTLPEVKVPKRKARANFFRHLREEIFFSLPSKEISEESS